MATILSKFATSELNTNASDRRGQPVVNRFYVDLKAADLVAGNLIDLGILPAGHTVTEAVIVADDLDTNGTPTITLDVGIMSGTTGDAVSVRTVGTELFSASTAAQAGTVATAATTKTAYTIAASQSNRSIGAKIVAGAATAAAGRLRLVVTAVPVDTTNTF